MESSDPKKRNEGPEFAAALQRLKERGCSLLVTGEVGTDVSRRMSQQLFGAPMIHRRRVMGLTREAEADPWFPQTAEASEAGVKLLTVVDIDTNRAAAAVSPPVAGTVSKLDHCQRQLFGAIDIVRGKTATLDPAELRVGFYSALDLLERYPTDDVRGFLAELSDSVVAEDGMGHVHLPCPDEAEVVEDLAPVFDARIELRQRHGEGLVSEQRWHLPTYGTTKWIRL